MNPNLNRHWSEFIDSAIVKKVRRGTTLCRVSSVLALSSTAIALQLEEAAWAACAFTWAGVFGFAALQLKSKFYMSLWLSENPNEVFWVHPADRNGLVTNQGFETCDQIVLHLKNGYSFELALDQKARGQLDEWRKSYGASIKWGPLDDEKLKT